MEPRVNYFSDPAAGKVMKYVMSTGKAIKELPLPATTRELVSLRVSQINGCAICLDMHTKEAEAAGESAVRMNLVPAWREATVFTEAERAALELAEEGTRIGDGNGGVSDEVWERAAKHYDESQLVALSVLISFMNMVNRANVITQQPSSGDYVPGQYH